MTATLSDYLNPALSYQQGYQLLLDRQLSQPPLAQALIQLVADSDKRSSATTPHQ